MISSYLKTFLVFLLAWNFFALVYSQNVNNGDDLPLSCSAFISDPGQWTENACGICENTNNPQNIGCDNAQVCATGTSADALEYQEYRPSSEYQLVCIHVSTDPQGNRNYLPSWKKVGYLADYFHQDGGGRFSPYNGIAGTTVGGETLDCTCGGDLAFTLGGGGGLTGEPPKIIGSATCYETELSTYFGSNRMKRSVLKSSIRNNGLWANLNNNHPIAVVHVGYQVFTTNGFYKVDVKSSSGNIPPQNWIYRFNPGEDVNNPGELVKIDSAEAWSTLEHWDPLNEDDLLDIGRPHHTFAAGTVHHGFMVLMPDDDNEHWVWVIQGFKYCISKSGCGGFGRQIPACHSHDDLRGRIVQPQIIVSAGSQIQIKYADYQYFKTRNLVWPKNDGYTVPFRQATCDAKNSMIQYNNGYDDTAYNSWDWCQYGFQWDYNTDKWFGNWNDDNYSETRVFGVTVACKSCVLELDGGVANGLISFDRSEVNWGIGTGDVIYNELLSGGGWSCHRFTGPWFTCCDNTCSEVTQELNSLCECVTCEERTCGPSQEWNQGTCSCDDCTPVTCWSQDNSGVDVECNSGKCKFRSPGSSPCKCEQTCDEIDCSGDRRDDVTPHLPPECRPCKTCSMERLEICPESSTIPPTHKWTVVDDDICECTPCEEFYGSPESNPDHPGNNCPANTFFDANIAPCGCVQCRDYKWDGRVEYDGEGKAIYWPNANGECRGTYELSPDECAPCIACEQVCLPGEKPDPDYAGKRMTKNLRPKKHKLSSKKNALPKISKNRHPLLSLLK